MSKTGLLIEQNSIKRLLQLFPFYFSKMKVIFSLVDQHSYEELFSQIKEKETVYKRYREEAEAAKMVSTDKHKFIFHLH